MRKNIVFCLLILLCFFIVGCSKDKNTFLLEEKYYEKSGFLELGYEDLDNLINNKESFAVFVYQPLCNTSSAFEKVLKEFLQNNQISFYKIAFASIKDKNLGGTVKYYPSFVIYKEGQIVDFLDANSNEDTEIYKSTSAFKDWFTKYVELKSTESIDYIEDASNNQTTPNQETTINEAQLENIAKEENKVNIYFFWGDGCPHCKEEFAFFANIKEKYGNTYNLYTFETFNNEDNAKLLKRFAAAMGDEVTGVPYTVIGSQSFSGFNNNSKSHFIDAIISEQSNRYDVYFDKIKK